MRRHNMTTTKENLIGEAYCFFHYSGKESISKVLPQIKEMTESPKEISLAFTEGLDNLDIQNDSALAVIAKQAKIQHLNHVLKATLPSAGNRRTSGFLGNIMNGIYTNLYEPTEPFYAGIVYKRGQQYVFKRE